MKPKPENSGLVNVDAQLIRLLYSNASTGVIVNILLAFMVCGVLDQRVPGERLGYWLVAVITISILRLYHFVRFARFDPPDDQIAPWRRMFMLGALASAATWGMTPWFFGPFTDIYAPTVLAFCLGGLMAGATAILGGVLKIYILFSLTIMGPTILWFVFQQQRVELIMGGMLLISVGALLSSAIIYRRILRDSIELSNALYRAKEEAEVANRAKSQFLSRMSHELRTPLSAILGFAQLMQEQHAHGSEQWRYLDQIIDASDHLLALINDLLDLSHIEAQTVELSLEPIACHQLLQDCIESVGPLAEEHQISFVLRAPAETLRVIGDPTRVRQVFLNLLSNACTVSQSGARIAIGARRLERNGKDQEVVMLYMEDLAHSIPEAQQDKMFLSYYKLGRGKSAVEDTGLGLTISQQLVELMCGRLTVSRAEDAHLTFGIELPGAGVAAVQH